MQLGDCLFDSQRGLLTNQLNGDVWHLPRAELQVLSLLVANKNKIVSKEKLGVGDEDHPALSDSSVTRAVFMLRSFLGPMHEHMIETVKGKGYRLKIDKRLNVSTSRLIGHKVDRYYQACITWLFGKYHRKFKAWVGVLVLLLAVGVALQWYYADHQKPLHTQPFSRQVITLDSGQQIEIISYSKSNTNNRSLIDLSERLSQDFALCHNTPWRQIYLSLSHDKQVFNITMRGEKMGLSLVRNLKLTDYRQQKSFISKLWFDEVSLCE
ncbi:helix-turn-helix domain-containing protein [Shewanella sp. Isolate11]|uniref:winged helix-turn-helix domain-containing protein n=1 Tax=Shewanella sp. Isolate11 TaxID=2908530 RepID=UPI001EFCD111|nr:helix-turn-helix domain-containing protein [Shewanella sp. Isolate11]MCG9695730.1 helix-turn-helix domain-containing protein [Shewanella sp. Isolate11]